MVDKIKAVDSTAATKKVAELEEKEAKKTEALQKQEEPKKTETTDSFKISSAYFADYQIKSFATDYVNRLISKYEGYDDIISRLRSYLGNFDIDEFKKLYPELESNSDLSMALYNDTLKFL